jgi:hypothetical protein
MLKVLAFAASLSLADSHYDGFTALSADGLPDTETWEDQEASNASFPGACKSLNEMFQSDIKCSIDRTSWKTFYVAELKRPNKIDRVNSPPNQFCGRSGLYFFSEFSAITQNDFQVCAKDEACKTDFLKRVKNINCIVQTKDAAPSLKLENGTLTFVITRKPNGDTPNGDGWVKAEAFKLFPLYKKLRSH